MNVENRFWQSKLTLPSPIQKNKFGLFEPKSELPSIYNTSEELSIAVERLSPAILYISDSGDGHFRVYGTSEAEVININKSNRKRLLKSLKTPAVIIVLGLLFLIFLNNGGIKDNFMPIVLIAIYGVNPLISNALDLWDLSRIKVKNIEALYESQRFELWMEQADFSLTWLLPAILASCFVLQIGWGMNSTIEQFGLVKPLSHLNDYYRLFSTAFVHGGIMHIFFNAGALLTVTGIFLKFANYGKLILVFAFSVLIGSLMSIVMLPGVTSVGASGGILGIIGYLVAIGLKHQGIIPFTFTRKLIKWLILIAIFGLVGIDFIDNGAHLGGAIGGALIGFFHRKEQLLERIEKVSAKEKLQMNEAYREHTVTQKHEETTIT